MKNIPYKKHVLVCMNETCKMQGSGKIYEKLKARIKELNLKQDYRPTQAICLGICGKGPNIAIWPEGTLYCGFTEDKIEDLIQKHLLRDEVLNELLYKKDNEG
ncbi:MAG: (2Fe-2S) ferredoxin domain-containing protein [Candidatus Melainabacteria bacterium]|nr:(2Fe-2S) ferredoxin domain-containing protein [Candidatus Melainabacteria bacterium]MBI3308125.1 (2Fe-2S) ferredoxin domain-containing protein [Candidatus Melainabacteria bacterium]